MRGRRRVALALSLATLALPLGSATAASTPAWHRPIIITGPAGSTATVTLPQTALFPNLGSGSPSSASKGGWSGLIMTRPGDPDLEWPTMATVDLTPAFRCPGAACRYDYDIGEPVFGPDNGNGDIVLPPGRYVVFLAGVPGSTVTATLRPEHTRGAPLRVRAGGHPAASIQRAYLGSGGAGHQVALHTWDQLPAARGGWTGVFSFIPYVMRPAGTISYAFCLTSRSDDPRFNNIGGAAPCGDFHGVDIIFGPGAGPSTPAGGVVPVGSFAAGFYGAATDSAGVGFDGQLTGAETWLQQVTIGVTLR